ncbi:unnamed protein product [Candidula unifasciata]|uniref:Uncharacterized protein n=1 Tax=Candidula unifasciata TaxID=100452 RepID=A0A8S3ZQA5_9EUPU|nr:unnamed protein product [Candidula unifasciata]
MGRTFYASLLTLYRLVVLSGADYDCPYQMCPCEESRILCANMGLDRLPPLTTTQATYNRYLWADNNNITRISNDSLPTDIIFISLTNNPILTIDDDAFQRLSTSLESLVLSNARFTKIPDAFLQLTDLTLLSISNTPIKDWNPVVMSQLGSRMETLTLENVSLTTWPRWLQNYTQLTELIIGGHSISSIPDDAFDNMANTLQRLTIANTSLTAVPKAVLKLHFLNMLSFTFSSISNLTWLPVYSKLNTLIIQNARISDADHAGNVLRPFADSLTQADFQANLLTKIPDVSFMTSLQILQLMNNQISDPVSGAKTPALQFLTLNNNPLSTISAGAVQNLPLLQSIKLANTKITRLPLSFASLSNLKYFDITGARDLVCTCLEVSLRPVLLKVDTLLGDCGAVSIRYFFASLSPSCPS